MGKTVKNIVLDIVRTIIKKIMYKTYDNFKKGGLENNKSNKSLKKLISYKLSQTVYCPVYRLSSLSRFSARDE